MHSAQGVSLSRRTYCSISGVEAYECMSRCWSMIDRFDERRLRAVQMQDVATIVDSDLPWNQFSGQRVLVTGASGFLGGYLTRTLLALYSAGRIEQPVHVLASVRSAAKARRQLSDQLDNPHL